VKWIKGIFMKSGNLTPLASANAVYHSHKISSGTGYIYS